MNLADTIEEIRQQIINVLFEDNTCEQVQHTLQRIYFLLESMLSVFDDGKDGRASTGICITPATAASCLLSYRRTFAYWQALKLALEGFPPEQEIKLVYPGCGPFATLVLPVLFAVFPRRLNITFIDYHQSALDSLQQRILAIGNPHIKCQFICGDATGWQPNTGIDILILECMLKGLDDEGQVSLVNHFSPFLNPQTCLIPQEIEVKANWIDMPAELSYCQAQCDNGKLPEAKQLRQYRVAIGDVFKLDKTTYQKVRGNQIACSELNWVERPDSHYHFALTMRLRLLADIWLEEYADGITSPFLPKIQQADDKCAKSNLSGYYHTGLHPGFVFNLT